MTYAYSFGWELKPPRTTKDAFDEKMKVRSSGET
jgi:hypothetical protein